MLLSFILTEYTHTYKFKLYFDLFCVNLMYHVKQQSLTKIKSVTEATGK